MTQSLRHTFVIAEAGVNHNGDVGRAVELVRIAASAGADAVKFQTFKAERIAAASAPMATYQSRNTGDDGSQIAMLKALELSDSGHRAVASACEDAGIEFMSTPFDEESATFLVDDIGVQRLKIASGELTNAPLLLHLARTDKPVILSTGMANLTEIQTALGVLAFGYTDSGDPNPEAFAKAYATDAGRAALRDRVTLLHCTSDYPAAPESINLAAMDTLAAEFELPVGFSDHSQGIAIPMAAVALGARVIEKHFTQSRDLPGPDHRASLEPDELTNMIAGIRVVEQAIGVADKSPVEAERDTAKVARKSLVALAAIQAGEPFSTANLGVKRPGDGVSPLDYWRYLGQPAARTYAPDELVEPQ